ncbi:MAG: hypothetical protein ACTH6N_14500 [Brachybacterium tyrofermentans]|uniref:hypothetical protein n=1 Tax=Brachybacterium tyrofermentans TaxID=47848 RepID=UPI0018671F2C|nr:hypothetical protein [Brachybacterium tyrofermentans]
MDDDSRGLVGPWIDGVSEEGTAREIADCTWTDEADAEFITAVRGAVPALLDALTRAEAQSETRRQQTAYWQERAEGFEARIADALALCDEWAAMGTRQMSIGAVRRALDGTVTPDPQ